jgi:cytidyltransferase-like protein
VNVVVSGIFDQLQFAEVRFLNAAALVGPVQVLVWETSRARFPLEERRYCLQALRSVEQVTVVEPPDEGQLPGLSQLSAGTIWLWPEDEDSPQRQKTYRRQGVRFQVVKKDELQVFPQSEPAASDSKRKKVIVTGCFDWLHSGHIRFFEEASSLGDLYVVVGSDTNVRLLKGAGHPLFPQEERRYLVGAVRHVTQALISSGSGWMDAEPEIEQIRPDIYLVNEDGDKPEKRAFCQAHSLDYVVLRRTPAPGLPRRSSSDLRGY